VITVLLVFMWLLGLALSDAAEDRVGRVLAAAMTIVAMAGVVAINLG
jgi:hypothetical protein